VVFEQHRWWCLVAEEIINTVKYQHG
jgi:hypothetical protein